MQLFYSPDYIAAGHAFPTTRKPGWIADSLDDSPIDCVNVVRPPALTAEEIATVHTREYVDALRTGAPRELAESQGFDWDPGLWTAATASNGGVIAAAAAARIEGVAGSLSSGLHHAKRDRGEGFCTFNGLALAARSLLHDGMRSVMILDLDAHCGGGTHSLIADEPRIVHTDVSVSPVDSYTPGPRGTLDMVRRSSDYLLTIERRLEERAAAPPAICLYNAGMDPHERCGIGGLAGITRETLAKREQIVFDWCVAHRVPVAFVLAGGYIGRLTQADLVNLHRLTIEAAARAAVAMRTG